VISGTPSATTSGAVTYTVTPVNQWGNGAAFTITIPQVWTQVSGCKFDVLICFVMIASLAFFELLCYCLQFICMNVFSLH
jgi:hypothetical protein